MDKLDDDDGDRLLNIRQVMALWSYKSRTSVYRAVMDGRLPEPVDIGRGQVRWLQSSVTKQMRSLPKRRR